MLLNLALKCVKTEYLSPRPTCYHSIHCYLSAILCSNSLLEILTNDSSSMPMFQNSQYTDAHGSNFYDVGRDQINVVYINNAGAMQSYFCAVVHSFSIIDLLALLQPVRDATYDSMGSASGCLEGTRQEVIRKIVGWIDGHSDQPVCWLNGAAGSGKSAISRTIANLCEGSNRLGASFFFLRGAGRRSTITHFISTLAYNLAFSVPATKAYIENALKRDPHIVHRSLERQFRQLIIDPVRSVTGPLLPMVITIDALDECDDRKMMADFIHIVTCAFRDHQLPLRFFFTSRVEEHIQKKFMVSRALAATCHLALQDFNADVDLRTFFRSCFSTIYEENQRLMRNIDLPWLSESDLDELVERSAGSFIFAFTLVNFVNDGSDLPHRKLRAGLESHAGLDPLYSQVLQTAPHSPHFDRVFGTVMLVTEPMSVADLGFFLRIDAGDVIHALQGVQSILIIPEDDVQPVRLFHT